MRQTTDLRRQAADVGRRMASRRRFGSVTRSSSQSRPNAVRVRAERYAAKGKLAAMSVFRGGSDGQFR